MHNVDQNSASACHWGVDTFLIHDADVLDCSSPHETSLLHIHCVSNFDNPGGNGLWQAVLFHKEKMVLGYLQVIVFCCGDAKELLQFLLFTVNERDDRF